jgi:NAD(P)-dependent dehydrogenase (short-subunit alcohol dehydrogenase family)
MSKPAKPVCVVVGVGPGTGAALARRFAAAEHAVALLARTTLISEPLARELPDARAYACDVTDAASVAATIAAIERDQGAIAVVAYNAGSGTWGTVETITPAQLEAAFRINTLGLLHVAQAVIPGMTARGGGAIVVTGATASRRGGAKTAAFAPAKAAQRSLAESMARQLWPKGIHVSLIIVDGMIDLARTRASMPDKPDSFFVRPDELAETAYHLATQPRSAWSFEVEARPFAETW